MSSDWLESLNLVTHAPVLTTWCEFLFSYLLLYKKSTPNLTYWIILLPLMILGVDYISLLFQVVSPGVPGWLKSPKGLTHMAGSWYRLLARSSARAVVGAMVLHSVGLSLKLFRLPFSMVTWFQKGACQGGRKQKLTVFLRLQLKNIRLSVWQNSLSQNSQNFNHT